jgi:hypothetical protein
LPRLALSIIARPSLESRRESSILTHDHSPMQTASDGQQNGNPVSWLWRSWLIIDCSPSLLHFLVKKYNLSIFSALWKGI